jgi:hypothetical protein
VARIVEVALASSASLAMPKSTSLGSPRPVNRMFSGLMSRCSTPTACAAASASAIAAPMPSASSTGSGPSAIRSASDPPCISCIVM